MPNLKIFATMVFFVTILVIGLEYLPKFYTQTVEVKTSLESTEKTAEKVIRDKEETKRTQIGYEIIGYFLLLSLLLYIKILIQRPKKLE